MKSVLVTGTSKGIGFETALAFARAGYRVHATMRNPAGSPSLAAVTAKENLPITVTAMDVDDDASVAEGIAAIQAEHGPIDVLVNNAGVECFGSIEELPMSDFRAVMETNYFGVLRCVKALIPQMRERRQGTIINVSSVAGSFSQPPTSPYSASKWALEAMSEGLAGEMKAFGVRVVLIKPGIIDTSMAQRISKLDSSLYPHLARMSGFFAATLAGEPARPSLVAQLMVDVANSDSWQLRYVVGPGAGDLLAFRKSMSDEDWVALHASDDATFQRLMSGG
jgi:NAD(P)-dependent dehydrogenase (short-subunit alcohol dehydrogenase family)